MMEIQTITAYFCATTDKGLAGEHIEAGISVSLIIPKLSLRNKLPMFSDLDTDDIANLGRIAGVALFAVAFVIPGVHVGPNDDLGFECAWVTLTGTGSFIASLLHGEKDNGFLFFFMVSGWITPLVLLGTVIKSTKIRRGVAKTLPVLLVAPWIVFAWPQSGGGAVQIRPSIGHYLWTAGCLLIFTPQYVNLFSVAKRAKTASE